MPLLPPRPRLPAHARRGFTVLELLIALVVVGILVALALPTFNGSIRKGRRSDAIAALSLAQQAQERWRNNKPAYANATEMTTAAPSGLGLPATSAAGYYDITIVSSTTTGFEASATAVAGKSQALDAGCQLLAVRMLDGSVGYGSGTSTLDLSWSDPGRCWAK